jgi:hypothetical protein
MSTVWLKPYYLLSLDDLAFALIIVFPVYLYMTYTI